MSSVIQRHTDDRRAEMGDRDDPPWFWWGPVFFRAVAADSL